MNTLAETFHILGISNETLRELIVSCLLFCIHCLVIYTLLVTVPAFSNLARNIASLRGIPTKTRLISFKVLLEDPAYPNSKRAATLEEDLHVLLLVGLRRRV